MKNPKIYFHSYYNHISVLYNNNSNDDIRYQITNTSIHTYDFEQTINLEIKEQKFKNGGQYILVGIKNLVSEYPDVLFILTPNVYSFNIIIVS